jgi:hypothetical protein
MPCFGVAALSYQLQITPDHLLGRVGTALHLLIWAATPVGAAAAGVLLDLLTTRDASLVFAAWVVVLSVSASLGNGLRRLDRQTTSEANTG